MKASLLFCLLVTASACAHAPFYQEDHATFAFVKKTCEVPPAALQPFTGSIWIKFQSPQKSGQVNAEVARLRPNGPIRIEINGPFGTTLAKAQIEGGRYWSGSRVNSDSLPSTGTTEWRGIPAVWLERLISGGVPCPDDSELNDLIMSRSDTDSDSVQWISRNGQKWQLWYSQNHSNQYFPRQVFWWAEKSTTQPTLELTLDPPIRGEPQSPSWEAKTVQGEIKLKWKTREGTKL